MYYITILFSIFLLFKSANSQANSSDILYDISPFIKIHKDGRVERLIGTGFVPASIDPKTGVQSKDIIISSQPNITARVYLPRNANPSRKIPLLVYFHGGAFFTESAASPSYHGHLNSVVSKANVVSVSVNYRVAPEHPLPTCYRDSWHALLWVFSHRKGNGSEEWLNNYVDFEHVHLAGDSAGGNIAHNTAILAGLHRRYGISIDGMVLNCPHFWGKKLTKDEKSNVEQSKLMESIWIHAYPNSKGFDDPLLNPAMDVNLKKLGCKRVLVYVAGIDILKDRGLYYTETLEKSGWLGNVQVVQVNGEEHDFSIRFPEKPNAVKMIEHFSYFLNN